MYTNTYDDSSHLISTLTQVLLDSVWHNSYFDSYEYFSGGRMLSHTWQYWWSGVIRNGSIHLYTYDDRGFMNTDTYQMSNDSGWYNKSRQTFSYTGNGRLFTRFYATWIPAAGSFLTTWKYTESYDENASLVGELNESFDTSASTWLNYDRTRYICDANGNSTDCIYETWDRGSWKPGLKPLIVFAQQDTVEYFPGYYQYHAVFTSYATGISQTSDRNSLRVYPNPAGSIITIETGLPVKGGLLLTILDAKGNVVISRNISMKKTSTDISSLPQAEYFIRLQHDGILIVSKFLKAGR